MQRIRKKRGMMRKLKDSIKQKKLKTKIKRTPFCANTHTLLGSQLCTKIEPQKKSYLVSDSHSPHAYNACFPNVNAETCVSNHVSWIHKPPKISSLHLLSSLILVFLHKSFNGWALLEVFSLLVAFPPQAHRPSIV